MSIAADGWEDVVKPVLARYSAEVRPSITRWRFRADAAFAIPALFDLLEDDGWDYAIRIKGNAKLHERIDWLTKRRPSRPPKQIRPSVYAIDVCAFEAVRPVLSALPMP